MYLSTGIKAVWDPNRAPNSQNWEAELLNWDDMRVFIAVARSGSFSSAGRRIGMDATTVARRTRRLETSLRATLIVRSRPGLELTAAGARLAEAGSSVEAAMEAADDDGAVNPVVGTVRIRVPEGFARHILAPDLPHFLDRRPGMRVEMVASPGYLSPTKREVDIAITSYPSTSSRLVVSKLTDYEIGLYASPDYLRKRGEPRSLAELQGHDFISYVDDLLYTSELRYLDSFGKGLRPRLTCSSLPSQAVMASVGGGIGAFPTFLVADSTELVRVLPEAMACRTYWIATHVDLHETARMRAVYGWISDLVKKNQAMLTPVAFAAAA